VTGAVSVGAGRSAAHAEAGDIASASACGHRHDWAGAARRLETELSAGRGTTDPATGAGGAGPPAGDDRRRGGRGGAVPRGGHLDGQQGRAEIPARPGRPARLTGSFAAGAAYHPARWSPQARLPPAPTASLRRSGDKGLAPSPGHTAPRGARPRSFIASALLSTASAGSLGYEVVKRRPDTCFPDRFALAGRTAGIREVPCGPADPERFVSTGVSTVPT
jgi:hypothetical protein